MSITSGQQTVSDYEDYPSAEIGFRRFLHSLADELFPFGDYREYQDEILYRALEAVFVDSFENVIIDGPTGIGKSPINVTIGRVIGYLYKNQRDIESYFNVTLPTLASGKTFYTTPQKQLRNQLAGDNDLNETIQMLKSRRDYICSATGENCAECEIKSDPDQSCRETAGCTYWAAKTDSMNAEIAALTFAMLVIDDNIPEYISTEFGEEQISFGHRDGVVVDEGHGLESQVASLFAGFTVSPWSLPSEVYGDAGEQVSWNADRFHHVEEILEGIYQRAKQYIERWDEDPDKEIQIEQCENYIRKVEYCVTELENDRPWVVNVDKVSVPGDGSDTKKIEIKPVDVDGFLQNFVWSRGDVRLISSATIPYRGNISEWVDRLGLPGRTKLISRPMPFPEEHRQIHTNTMVASMSGDGEDNNWRSVVRKIEEIHSHHEGENGLIHTNSYQRAERLADALGRNNVHVQERDDDQKALILEWEDSDKDILISPSMTEGVDLHGDRCRWQVLMKVPYPYVGDSRVSYLLEERNDWDWYMETASLAVQQSVGRAVRGPEPEEAASYYVIDEAFDKVMNRTNPPEWFTDAIREEPPEHWDTPSAAPWRRA